MLDPYRGEMTARYVLQENLEWAARERLLRQARPAEAKRLHVSDVASHLSALIHLPQRVPSLALRRAA